MLRRPLLFAAAGYSAAVFVCFECGFLAGCLAAGCAIVYLILRQHDNIPMFYNAQKIFCISFLIGTIAFAFTETVQDDLYDLAEAESDASCEITCIVKKIEWKQNDKGEKYVNIKAKGVMISYYSDDATMAPGDRIIVRGTIDVPSGRRNPGCFDYRLYLRSIGIRTIMTADGIETVSEGVFARRVYLFKQSFLQRLGDQVGSDTAAIMGGILFGDKSEIDEEVTETFKKNGTMHILAVSGLHIGIIYAFLLKLWNLLGSMCGGLFFGHRGIGFFMFTGAFFWCYMILCSFSPSVVRAVIMVLLHAFAQLTGRRYDINTAAFAVYLAVLLKNPYMLFNVGFEMSFLAVLSIALIVPYVNRVYQGLMGGSIAVQIGLGPFILYHFNYCSVIAVFVNVPVILLTGLIVPLGISQSVLLTMCGDHVIIISKLLAVMCDTLKFLNEKVAIDGITTFTLVSPDIRLLAGYYLALLILASEEGRRRLLRTYKGKRCKYMMKTIIWIMLLSAGVGCMTDDGFAKASVTFVDVGQGDCICIRCGQRPLHTCRSVYLIDGGGSISYNVGQKTLREYLLKNGMPHVDGAFVTHLHTDHYKGICELAQEGMVDRLYVYDGNRLREDQICEDTGLIPDQITYLCAGQTVRLRGNSENERNTVSIKVLWPEKKTESEYKWLLADETNENDSSLLFQLNYEGVKVLVTGDMDENGENAVIARNRGNVGILASEVLKVGHHGSKTSSSDSFINYVNPQIAVIQVGQNNLYGHPNPETLQRFESCNIPVYRNDRQGAVGISIRRGKIHAISTII